MIQLKRKHSVDLFSILAFKWRQELPIESILDIQKDEICGTFFNLFGYNVLSSEQSRNFTENSFIKDFDFDL